MAYGREMHIYIAEFGQAILKLPSFKVGSWSHQRGISLLQKFSDIFGNMKHVPLKLCQFPKIKI